ncbi:MAG TPA: nitrilase-related carbon-nitrogen hydrolase [Leptospiraceae bacterium]|nr:nitrilase-related carbon-nitrogen hydrolase [Leptospiraceae bacterium]HMY69624.1 nitrilase-related carbon-nitrogen hydrolase [Leptospiraceae bacterium]HNF13458.1 nitrilase-related carbon-nitrogen hydrolase [Leptospiraceae bacterium]HNF25985.1 nitrilase-related carbon-nitrogen hydrolase [Leptospiraceae bacterium]HNI96915.1 nitrilase-related carbon-nitrogen hydrolase [Leptospiraceae bacterium]
MSAKNHTEGSLRLALFQTDIVWEDRKSNLKKVSSFTDSLLNLPDIIVLPEAFALGFTMRSEKFAEEEDGETESFLMELSVKTGSAVVGGLYLKNRNGKPWNTVSAAAEGKIICRYKKNYPFSFGGEDRFFSAGTERAGFDWKGFRISLAICFDLRFPELFRGTAGETDLYIVSANWPSVRIHHWLSLLRARAVENQAYLAGVNRTGNSGGFKKIHYNGYTGIFYPSGYEKTVQSEKEEVLETVISKKELYEYRESLPFLKDIRKDRILQ